MDRITNALHDGLSSHHFCCGDRVMYLGLVGRVLRGPDRRACLPDWREHLAYSVSFGMVVAWVRADYLHPK